MEGDILYLCDRSACDTFGCVRDDGPCKHTVDISHAKNFEKDGAGNYWEKDPKPLIILKFNTLLKKEVLDRIQEEFKKQMMDGVIFCDSSVKLIEVIPDGTTYDIISIGRSEEDNNESQRPGTFTTR
jgi:hypothetical protein